MKARPYMGATKIKEIRLARGWTLRGLADKVRERFPGEKFNASLLSKIERKTLNVSVGRLEQIAEALEVPPEQLLGWAPAAFGDIAHARAPFL